MQAAPLAPRSAVPLVERSPRRREWPVACMHPELLPGDAMDPDDPAPLHPRRSHELSASARPPPTRCCSGLAGRRNGGSKRCYRWAAQRHSGWAPGSGDTRPFVHHARARQRREGRRSASAASSRALPPRTTGLGRDGVSRTYRASRRACSSDQLNLSPEKRQEADRRLPAPGRRSPARDAG